MRFFILLIYSLSLMLYAQENNTISVEDSCRQKKITIAVLEFNGNGIYATDICISSQFREELNKTGKFEVLKRSAMHLIFEEAVYPWFECDKTECAAEIGKILAVQKVVLGSLIKQYKTLILTIYIIASDNGKIENTYTEKCTKCLKDELFLKTIRKICLQIADHQAGD